MKDTVIELFKNTPLIDFQNTIHFKSNNERDTSLMIHMKPFVLKTRLIG